MPLFATGQPLAAGQPAPEFALPSQDGSRLNLRDLRGSWVVLYFYPKDNTSICTLEARAFEKDLERYRQLNAVVIGVSLDSTASHQRFCAKQGLTFKLLSDSEKTVAAAYGSLQSIFGFKVAARHTFLIDPEGRIAQTWTGMDIAHHSEEVLSSLAKRQGLN
jgi:thioredoxin-dependent peroxiredoxin